MGGIYCEQWGIGGGFTATERSGTGGITGTEIRNGAVQKTALRLHSGALACRSEAEAQGIRPQYRTVYVRSDYPGYPGTAGKRVLHICGSLIIHFHVFSLRSFPPILGVHGRGSAAARGYFVLELVTICKQLAPNLKRARMDVSYIYLYIERVPARFSGTPGGGLSWACTWMIDTHAAAGGIHWPAGRRPPFYDRMPGTQPITCGQAAGRDQSGSSYTRSTGRHHTHRMHSRSRRIQYIHEDTRTARAPATGHEDLSGGLLFI